MECHHLLKFRISLKISTCKPYNSPFHISLFDASFGCFYAAEPGQIVPLWWRTDIVRAFIPPDVPWQAQHGTHLIVSRVLAAFSVGWFYVVTSLDSVKRPLLYFYVSIKTACSSELLDKRLQVKLGVLRWFSVPEVAALSHPVKSLWRHLSEFKDSLEEESTNEHLGLCSQLRFRNIPLSN